MSVRTSHRVSAGIAPLVAAGLLFSACGSAGDDAASRPTITLEIGETAYATLPVATTVPEADAANATDDVAAGGVQDYTVQAGDYGLKVASDFGVSLDDLESINGWSDASREFPNPGSVIKIPAGGTTQTGETTEGDVAETTDGDTATTADGTAAGETGEAIPEPGSNCEPGSYTIEASDTTRFAVAAKFDVTVEAMDAANASTPGYDAFYPGLGIVIPAKDDC